jgi:serine/threonine protein kinase
MELRDDPGTKAASLTGFLQAIRNSAILSGPQLEKLEARAAAEGATVEPGELAARLVREGVLTEFQSRQILKGRTQGLVFGRYVILDILGRGAMARVYKAWHRMMGRVVALKILDPKYVANPRSLARFRREMQLVGRLDHPNVVRAFDADHVGESYFIAMEYSPGRTLDDLLKERGALSPADAVYFASQAADGLAHAHSLGVLHRDIKPSNLLLTDARKVKVLDFGLGTLLEKEEVDTALTAAGITVGTPDYISPEQARMVKLDGRSDLYSLGCTMYHLISGQLPFKGESSMDCIVGRITGRGIPIGQVKPGLPPRLVQTIEKLMAVSADDRYQTAEEAAEALRSLLRPRNATAARPAPVVTAAASPSAPAPASSPAPTASAPAAVKPAEREAPTLPARARAHSPRAKAVAAKQPWARLTQNSRWTLAAVGAAVAAIGLIASAVMLFRSSPGENPARPSRNDAGSAPRAALEVPDTSPPAVVARSESVRPRLVIESPGQGAMVNMREDLAGRLESGGWPVIFIQAMIPGQPWWCQAPITKVEGGKFTAQVVFGDESTPSGTKYRLAGVVAPTQEAAMKFAIGAHGQALPEGLPRSDEVVVTHR